VKLILATIIGLILSSIIYSNASAASWVYPMDSYKERLNLKEFGIFVDDDFYIGKESLFPFNRFHGYHAGVDLEIFSGEKTTKVPVYSTSTGQIIFSGNLPGYGGVILQNLDNENHTVLYGHVKIDRVKVGQKFTAGELLTYLGDGFSQETSKERKHLHFAIYEGKNLYFKGHELSLTALNAKWENPSIFLKNRGAIAPQEEKSPSILTSPSPQNAIVKEKTSFFISLIQSLKNLLIKINFYDY